MEAEAAAAKVAVEHAAAVAGKVADEEAAAAKAKQVQAEQEGAAKQARHPTLPGLSVCQSTDITSSFHTIG